MIQEKVKIVIVKPGEAAKVATVENDLKKYQEIVNGCFKCTTEYFLPEMLIVCNGEGKIRYWQLKKDGVSDGGNPYRPNRVINKHRENEDVIFGTFFIIGNGEDDFIGLDENQIRRALYRFRVPQRKNRP